MTLEVSVSEVVEVVDVFGAIKQFFMKLIRDLMGDDEDEENPDIAEEDGNKSPPQPDAPQAEEASPPDLGVNVTDQPKAGEHFGP